MKKIIIPLILLFPIIVFGINVPRYNGEAVGERGAFCAVLDKIIERIENKEFKDYGNDLDNTINQKYEIIEKRRQSRDERRQLQYDKLEIKEDRRSIIKELVTKKRVDIDKIQADFVISMRELINKRKDTLNSLFEEYRDNMIIVYKDAKDNCMEGDILEVRNNILSVIKSLKEEHKENKKEIKGIRNEIQQLLNEKKDKMEKVLNNFKESINNL